MAENTAISWTTHTFNPWWGCTKVGPGCDHCYAETFDKRVGGAHWGTGAPRRLIKDWSQPRKWDRAAQASGERPWVFCASMADVFDNEVPTEWRDRLWDLVRECRNLRWQFVTKRISNAAKMLPSDWAENFGHCGILITVVNQAEADRDIPRLLATPAPWRGLSMEPLLGPVEIWTHQIINRAARILGQTDLSQIPGIDWVIVGGESGPGARPMHPDWARKIRDACAKADVPFHFKQWGQWAPNEGTGIHENALLTYVPHDGTWGKPERTDARGHAMHRIDKKLAGRLLDGIEHNGMPLSG